MPPIQDEHSLLRAPPASLRFRWAVLVVVIVGVPLIISLFLQISIQKQSLLNARVEALLHIGRVLGEIAATERDLRDPLERYGAEHSDLEVMFIGYDGRVVSSTRPERVGRIWTEDEIEGVMRGRQEWAWAMDYHEGIGPVVQLTLPVEGLGVLHLAEPQRMFLGQVSAFRWRGLAFTFGLLAAVGALVWLAAEHLILKRVATLHAMMERSGWLESSQPSDSRRPEGDELSRLKVSLERALSRIQQTTGDAQRRLIEAERLAAAGELTAGLAHEIRNPLQIIRGNAEYARRNLCRNERLPEGYTCNGAEAFEEILHEVLRMENLVRTLLDYTRPIVPQPVPCILSELIQQGIDASGVSPPQQENLDIPSSLVVLLDPTLVERILANLVRNAWEAAGRRPAGCVSVRARSQDDQLLIEVEDNGPGVAPEDQDKLFKAFFSRKEAGTGLGLALSRRLAETLGGTLTLEPGPVRGMIARLVIPGRTGPTGPSLQP